MGTIRVGVIGLGFMGKTHLAAYQAAARDGLDCRVVAVADARLDQAAADTGGNLNPGSGAADLAGIAAYADPATLLARADLDAVSICTPTHTHTELGIAAVRAGAHVLMEKPVAIQARDVRRLAAAAGDAGRVVLPAMVMRFWPGWAWLRDRIADGSLGRLTWLALERLGSRPAWNPGFYADDQKSGGALVDLHIHDADFILWCLGRPTRVDSVGSLVQVTSVYRYDAHPALAPGAAVVATGGWAQQPAMGFRMRYLANFERASVDFDLARGTSATMLHDDSGSRVIEADAPSGYDAEVRHFLRVVRGAEPPRASLEDAADVAELLDTERSLVTGAAQHPEPTP